MDLEVSSSEGIEARKDDVLKYINKKYREVHSVTGTSIIYFNTVTKYKVGSAGFRSDGFKDLCRDLGNKALSNGFYLIKMDSKSGNPITVRSLHAIDIRFTTGIFGRKN